MQKQQLKIATLFANNKGGDVEVTDTDGVVKFALGLRGEIMKGAHLLPYIDATDTIRLTGGVSAILSTGGRLYAQPATPVIESGANPDFQPTNYSDAEIRMRKLLKEVNDKSTLLEKRQKSFENAGKAIKAKKQEPDDEPVIEKEPVEPAKEDSSEKD